MNQHIRMAINQSEPTLFLARTVNVPISREVYLGLPKVFEHSYTLRSCGKRKVHLEENNLRDMRPCSVDSQRLLTPKLYMSALL